MDLKRKENYFDQPGLIDEWLAALEPLCRRRRASLHQKGLSRAALLVLDMQDYFVHRDSHAFVPASKGIIENISRLQEAFVSRGLPVIQTRHLNDKTNAGCMAHWWQELISEENPLSLVSKRVECSKTEKVELVTKTQYDAFFNTRLERMLKEKGVSSVIVTGVMAHLCCETTARAAFVRGFDVFFVMDATASYHRDFHWSTLANLAHGFALPVLTSEIQEALEREQIEGGEETEDKGKAGKTGKTGKTGKEEKREGNER